MSVNDDLSRVPVCVRARQEEFMTMNACLSQPGLQLQTATGVAAVSIGHYCDTSMAGSYVFNGHWGVWTIRLLLYSHLVI